MIPERMKTYLENRFSQEIWNNRLISNGSLRYLEFTQADVDSLSRMGITADNLGPHLVVCMWEEDSPQEIGGYLVVDNLAMGKPAMGGIRMLPDITPDVIHNLARGMTLKNAAADLPYGGGKSGIVADPGISGEKREAIIRTFAKLISRYTGIYLSGPDVGTNDADLGVIASEIGLDNALSKPASMGGNQIDELGGAGGGIVIALEEIIKLFPKLGNIPQFSDCSTPNEDQLDVIIQGFGAVGAHAAKRLQSSLPHVRVKGVSDVDGYIFSDSGLPVNELFNLWKGEKLVSKKYYQTHAGTEKLKFSSEPDDLLREDAFCFFPCAPIADYLSVDLDSGACITTSNMGRWSVIIEGANTYSPNPTKKARRIKMEQVVYRNKGILIATDYLVNSGGVIFGSQEHLLRTPDNLRIPEDLLGDRTAVSNWLDEHSGEFEILAEKRRIAGEEYRDRVIRQNMRELVELLSSDPDLLPYEAAELISIRRITSREMGRTTQDIMEEISTARGSLTIKDTAQMLIQSGTPIVAIIDETDSLIGVVTRWDITQATANGFPSENPVEKIMTGEVITTSPDAKILDLIQKFEQNEISAMPVVDGRRVIGMVSVDILTRKTLMNLLITRSY